MRYYTIEPEIFEKFPAFQRGVVIATGINNREANQGVGELLNDAVTRVGPAPSPAEIERISIWNYTYCKFGVDPDKYTPSIRFLHEQIRRGKPPRSITNVVDIMNLTSLAWATPCGGDDLDSLQGGDLRLGFATGTELFAPLFKPRSVEHPNKKEVIYYTPQTQRVMCRRWTWRNADFSKITPETQNVAVNIDMMMPPFREADLNEAVRGVASLLSSFCGGVTHVHVLNSSNPSVELNV